jgi:hypothetical protein
LSIKVVDTDGHPVSGILVNGFNHIPQCAAFFGQPCEDPVALLPKLRPATTVWLDVVESSMVSVVVRDGSDKLVQVLVEAELLAGQHRFTWDGLTNTGQRVPDGVYRVEARAVRQSIEVYRGEFRVYLFTALDVQLGPPFGTTDASGIIETTDILRFPGVRDDVLTLHGANELGEATCDFQFSNSLTVLLYSADANLGSRCVSEPVQLNAKRKARRRFRRAFTVPERKGISRTALARP